MSPMKWWRCGVISRRLHGAGRPRDAGFTLMEMMVGMTLMGVFLTMFGGAITMMYDSANKSESLNDTTAQLNQAFNRLDNSVRYASAITAPGKGAAPASDWYVEFQTSNTPTVVCTQLRINQATAQLQQRTWTVANAAASNPSGWLPLASNLVNGNAAAGVSQPFAFIPASTTAPAAPYQGMQVLLQSQTGGGTTATISTSKSTFVALNTTATTPITGICAEWGRPS
jgi:prepilin-type N-terminal cleavage/methylation domain-containing protein